MNHGHICDCWVAHNLGRTQVTLECWRSRKNQNPGVYQRTARVTDTRKGSRVSYRGDTIYSHHWWPMGRFFTNARGEKCVIARKENYSKSTAKHKSDMYHALGRDRVQTFVIDSEPCLDHAGNCAYYLGRMKEAMEKALRARNHALDRMNEAAANYKYLHEYCRFFDLEAPPFSTAFVDPRQMYDLETKLIKKSLAGEGVVNVFWRTP